MVPPVPPARLHDGFRLFTAIGFTLKTGYIVRCYGPGPRSLRQLTFLAFGWLVVDDWLVVVF